MLKAGHRGARGHAPENTLKSFGKALELGADMIELDVRKCASGDLVCIHDYSLKRLTGKSGKIKKKTLEELKKLSIGGERIPTLYETLDIIGGKVCVNLHLKESLADDIYAVIKKYLHKGLHYDNFIISSFNKKELKRLHFLDKNIRLGYLCIYPIIPRISKKIKLYSIHPYHRMLRKRHIMRMHNKDFKVFVWTVNKRENITKFTSWGVDAIFSDYPERI